MQELYVMLKLSSSSLSKFILSLQDQIKADNKFSGKTKHFSKNLHLTVIGGKIQDVNIQKLLDFVDVHQNLVKNSSAHISGIDTFTGKNRKSTVLKLNCQSMSAHILNKRLAQFFDEVYFPDLKPHITIATFIVGTDLSSLITPFSSDSNLPNKADFTDIVVSKNYKPLKTF